DDARIIAPGEPERSVLYYRLAKLGAGRMPRIGAQAIDPRATRLIADWIAHLPGAPAPAPAPAPPVALDEAIHRATESTRGALALVRLIDQGEVSPANLRAIVAQTRDHPRAEIRDLFERFVPAAERVVRLGDAIEPAA